MSGRMQQQLINRIVLFSVALIVGLLFYTYYETIKDSIFSFIGSHTYFALGVLGVILEGVPQFIPPDLLLFFGNVLQMNAFYTLLVVLIGTSLGSLVSYKIGSWGGDKVVMKFISKKSYDTVNEQLNKYGKYALPVMTFVHMPYFPLLLGAMRYNYRDFLILGIGVRMIKYTLTALVIYYLSKSGLLSTYSAWFGY